MPYRTGLSGGSIPYRQDKAKRRRTGLAAARSTSGGVGVGVTSIDNVPQTRRRNPGPAVGGNTPVGPGKQTGLGQNYQAGLGQQLSSRVSSGAITQEQAQQTAAERQTLEQAYGENWRHHVYGDRGYAKRTREALAKNPDDPQIQALYKALMEERKEALARARAKLGQAA